MVGRCFSAMAIASLLAWAANAQTVTGRISGTITDISGAAVPGASVAATDRATGTTWSAQTDERGFYVLPNLAVGDYSVEVEVKGFQKARKDGLTIDADSRLTADFALAVGQVSEQIQVTSVAGDTVNETSGELARVIDAEQVDATALNGRNYSQLITMIPGVAVLDEDQMAITTSLSTASQSVNGNRTNANSYTVDGAFNLDAGSNSSQVTNVSVDFVREVKIQTSNFSAEYGRMSGASINVVTKSGTNEIHGALFEYLRNDLLDARNYFAPTKSKLDFNNFGWNLGGPLRKNKLFLFGGQEWKSIRRDAEPVRFSIPTRAERAGYFSDKSSKIYYPGTTTPVPNKDVASLMTPDGKAIANMFNRMEKEATGYRDVTTGSNAVFQGNNPFNSREELARMDYRMSDRHTFYARYLHDSYNLVDPFAGDTSKFPSDPTKDVRPGGSAQLAHTAVLSPMLVNEAKANVVWLRDNRVPYGDVWQRSTYGFVFPKIYGGGEYPDGIPRIQVSGLTYFKSPDSSALAGFTDLSFADNLTRVRGQHTFKAGLLVSRTRRDQNGQSQYNASVVFNNKGNPNSTQVPFADSLLGNFLTYDEAAGDPVGFFRYTQFEAYAMDSWKATGRLSLEIGARYYWMQPAYAQANNIVNFSPAFYDPSRAVTVNLDGTLVANSGNTFNGLVRPGGGVPAGETGRVPGATSDAVLGVPVAGPRGLYPTPGGLAPRFGFAYAPFTGNKTVLRGGFGMYDNRPEISLISPMLNTPPYSETAELTNGNLGNPAAAAAAAPAPIANIQAVDPRLKNSYTMNFSLGVQRELPKGVFAEVTYVGNLGRHLLRQPDINQPAFQDYQVLASYPSSARPSVNAFRRYKGFSAINMRLSDSNSNYNALQAYMTRRKGNLMITASYTWAKALADTSKNSEDPEDPFNRHFNYGPASYDRRQLFVTTFNYMLPFFKTLRGIRGGALGGWEASGVVRAQTGPMLTVTQDSVAGVRRADYLGGNMNLPSGQRSADHWFNTAVFTTSPDSRRGTSGPGILEGAGLYTWDTSLRKQFRVTERVRLRFQADTTNLMNHANFRTLSAKVSSKTYGSYSQAGPARNIQFGLRMMF